MEYTHIQLEYTKEIGNKIKKMVMDIKGGLMDLNTMESTRMVWSGEKEFNKMKANYTESYMNKTSFSALAKYLILLYYDLVEFKFIQQN